MWVVISKKLNSHSLCFEKQNVHKSVHYVFNYFLETCNINKRQDSRQKKIAP